MKDHVPHPADNTHFFLQVTTAVVIVLPAAFIPKMSRFTCLDYMYLLASLCALCFSLLLPSRYFMIHLHEEQCQCLLPNSKCPWTAFSVRPAMFPTSHMKQTHLTNFVLSCWPSVVLTLQPLHHCLWSQARLFLTGYGWAVRSDAFASGVKKAQAHPSPQAETFPFNR